MDPGMGFFSLPAATGVAPPSSQQQQVIPYGVEIPTRVFVGGCPYNMTELELSQFFNQFGEVRDTKIITDRDGGKSKGYGFVTFAREEDAIKVYSQGSIYYDQKKLNVSKAIRKYGGQYKKANQEYVDGQRMVWMHPNGYLLSRQEGGWNIEQAPSHSQPVKLCYSFLPASPPHPPAPPPPPHHGHHGMYYAHPPTYHTGTNAWVGLGPTPNYNQQVYNYPIPPPYTHIANTPPLSAISTITTPGNESLESSGSSLSSSHPPPSPPHSPAASREHKENFDTDVKVLEEKAKQLSFDSAYTSEIDLDTSNSSTATNSGATSPKLAKKEEKAEEKDMVQEQVKESRSPPQNQSTEFKEFIPNSFSPSANTAAFSPPSPLMQPSLEQQHYQQWVADPHSSHHYINAPPSSPASLQLAAQQSHNYGYSPALQVLPPKLLSLVSSPMAMSSHLF